MERHSGQAIVVEGKNAEEALQAACDRLNTTPNQVEYEIVESGKGGVLGFLKGKTVRIRVWEKSASERMVADIVRGLFARMGIEVDHRVTRVEDAYEIDLETPDSDGLLIGRGGETLKALQHLISRMVGHRDETIRIRVDVAGYRKRRQEQLRRKARDLAERALSIQRDTATEPLPADERRIVHMALTSDPRVETRAIGDGQIKRVAVCPVASAKAAGGSGGAESASAGERGQRATGRTARGRSQGRSSGQGRGSPSRRSGQGEARTPRGETSRAAVDTADTAEGKRGGSDASKPKPGGEGTRRRRSPGGRRAGREEQADAARKAEEAPPETSSSYFNIPESMRESSRKDEDDPDEEGIAATPITWGRRRRPGRGRR